MWPTPTPYPTSVATPALSIDGEGLFVEMAEQGVQIWQTANNSGVIDMLMFAILVMFVIFAVWSISRKVQEL